ncbi:hypothetical protein SAMN05421690_100638 [Nitrosomonas sp. Nm51]|uniref:hypothetical protein n=1 Tax=Nitrosomonas sp. Nm51 TaxID=133720 RepID=UPI0008CEDDE1|nr:hypothetical protein [Nitrosomonas sp. Nm51]SER03258.1 hypothetical protein SAMN05421690_100638 [Nitrosomonas sp. Nm51]
MYHLSEDFWSSGGLSSCLINSCIVIAGLETDSACALYYNCTFSRRTDFHSLSGKLFQRHVNGQPEQKHLILLRAGVKNPVNAANLIGKILFEIDWKAGFG